MWMECAISLAMTSERFYFIDSNFVSIKVELLLDSLKDGRVVGCEVNPLE